MSDDKEKKNNHKNKEEKNQKEEKSHPEEKKAQGDQNQQPQKDEVSKEVNKLVELEEKAKLADEYLDELQRVQADFENFRKRKMKEQDEFRKYVLEGFLYKMLDVVDNIQRTIEAGKQNHNYESLVSGAAIIEKQILELLKSQGAVPVQVNLGDHFDPYKHQAVSHENSDKYKADTVSKVLQSGYSIGERVLRPAMVVVSSGPVEKKD